MTVNDRRAVQLGLGAVMLWSTVATAFSLSLKYLTPLQLVTFASVVSWCFLALRLLRPRQWHALRSLAPRVQVTCLLVGWINPGLYYLVLFAAYDQLPAQEAMAINYSWGITLALVAAPLLKQRLSLGALLATCISYAGIIIIATRGAPFSLNLAQPAGVGLALLSTVIWSLYWVLAGALYVGLFEMGIAFVFWLAAMKATSSTLRISSLIFLSPPVSLLLIWLVAGEPLRLYTFGGLALILGGLALQRHLERS
ncbi:MAG: DMT family transporter [Gammaproteobacteria bacterium]|nr:DMT family transporter [Gammaproteobacteria bacterium]